MDHQLPTYVHGSFARFSLSFAQVVFNLGCLAAVLGGLILVGIGISRGDVLLILGSIIGTIVEFTLCYAFSVVVTVIKVKLFPDRSHHEPTNSIRCENGHDFEISKGQAGSSIACPSCGAMTNVPALSKLDA